MSANGTPKSARAQQLAPGAGEHAGAEDRDAERGEHERVLERQHGGDERAGVGGGDRRARRVQRARAALVAISRRARPAAARAAAGRRTIATAKWLRSDALVEAPRRRRDAGARRCR